MQKVEIIPDKKYPNMYRLRWPDGTISIGTNDPKPWEKDGLYGFYSKARASELAHIETERLNETLDQF